MLLVAMAISLQTKMMPSNERNIACVVTLMVVFGTHDEDNMNKSIFPLSHRYVSLKKCMNGTSQNN